MTYSPAKSNAWYSERNQAIVAAYRNGETAARIAEYWRLDVKTVTEILHGYGVKRVGRVW